MRGPPISLTNPRNAGRKPTKLNALKAAMKRDITTHKISPDELRSMLEKNLVEEYGRECNAARTTVRTARQQVLSEIKSRQGDT